MMSKTYDFYSRNLDLRWRIPRPANGQHLSSAQALRELLATYASMTGKIVAGFVIAAAILFVTIILPLESAYLPFALLGIFGAIFIGIGTSTDQYFRKYHLFFQRETYGKARWATLPHLFEKGFVRDTRMLAQDECHPDHQMLALGNLGGGLWGDRYQLAFRAEDVASHVGIFGPPKSGKSASFFIHVARQWSQIGAMVCLDIKKDLYRYTSRYYRNCFVLDLIDPASSDRLDIFQTLRDMKIGGDRSEFAYELASLIIGFDPERKDGENGQFFQQSSVNLLKLLLLHIAATEPGQSLGYVSQFLSEQTPPEVPTDPKSQPRLVRILQESPDPDVRIESSTFIGQDPKTRSNIISSLDTKLKPFRSPSALNVFAPPAAGRKGSPGPRRINLSCLRDKGSAIYVAVTEGDADRFKTVLTTIFGVMSAYLRKTTDQPGAAFCMIMLDEAGNVPLKGLSRDVNAGRGRKMAYCLGYQNLAQVHDIYGKDGGDAIIESLGIRLFLPGCSGNTAEMASRLGGKTTVYSRSDTDAKGDAFDNRRESEAVTDLIAPDDVRRQLEYREFLAICRNADPVRCAYFPDGKEVDTFLNQQPRYEAGTWQ